MCSKLYSFNDKTVFALTRMQSTDCEDMKIFLLF